MYGKNYPNLEEQSEQGMDPRQSQFNNWKMRFALKQQRKQLQKRLFGEHYNYSKIGLNKEKKYMLEEQKNTQIERSNRILLEKIQKIAKRSVPNGLRKRAFTQQPQEDVYPQQKSVFKQSKFFNQLPSNNDNKSHHQLSRMNISQYRTPRSDKKILFSGIKQAQGKLYQIRSFIEKNKFVLQIQLGKMNQKIKIDLDNYKLFYRDYLEQNHGKILQFLEFNGVIFELKSIKNQQTFSGEENHLLLPQIQTRTDSKYKLHDKSDSKIS